MLEHQKLVLQNVAFSKELFRKELNKSLAWLNVHERDKLHAWLKMHYCDAYGEIIEDVFRPEKAAA